MGAQGIFRHQLLGNLPRNSLIHATLDVDFGKLIELKFRILAQFLALSREIRLFGIGLRTDRHILAGGHRHGASHQSCDTRDQDGVWRRSRRGNADDQARGRENAVIGPENRCSQPADAVDEVVLRGRTKTADRYPAFDQSRPSSMRRTTTIRMRPRMPTPP